MTIRIYKKATKLGYKYYPYQEEMIRAMLESPTDLLYNGSHMGLGKTIISYGYAYNKGVEKLLVVCPASLRINWLREAEIWGGPNLQKGLAILSGKDLNYIESRNRWKKGRNPSPLIVSYDMLVTNKRLRSYVLSQNWDMVIADEFHNCRNIEAQRTMIMLQILEKAPCYHLLSGTPMMKSGEDLFPACHSIVPYLDYVTAEDRELCNDHYKFSRKFAFCYNGQYGMQYKRVRNPEYLKAMLKDRGKFFHRKLKSEVLEDLPEKTYHKVEFSFDVESSDIGIEEIERFIENFIKDPDGAEGGAKKNPAIGRLRRELGEAKAASPECTEFVTSILEAGNPVVLFAYHKNVINMLMQRFKKWNPVKLDGSVSPTKKQAAVDAFQSGDSDVFIGQLQAAGAGITLTRASDAVFYELDWLPGINEQCCDRLHRISQKNAVNLHFLVSQNKFDLKIIKEMIAKQRAINKVI